MIPIISVALQSITVLDSEGRVDLTLSSDSPLHTWCDLFQYCRGVKFTLKLFRRLEVNCKRGLSSSNISWKDLLDFVILNFRLVSTMELVLLNTTGINIFIFILGISVKNKNNTLFSLKSYYLSTFRSLRLSKNLNFYCIFGIVNCSSNFKYF